MIGKQQLSFITAIRRRRFESFGKELKKGVRVVAGEHIVRSVPASPGRNSNYGLAAEERVHVCCVEDLFRQDMLARRIASLSQLLDESE
jgi:hypothetical protein